MTDQQFAQWLRTIPREKSPEEVERLVHERDVEQGPYIPHEHRCYYEESRH